MLKHPLTVVALLMLLATPLAARAESIMNGPRAEWAGIKNILSVMGRGTLSPSDQKSVLDILDVKSTVEGGRSVAPTAYPATPVAPAATVKQPPRRSPSAF